MKEMKDIVVLFAEDDEMHRELLTNGLKHRVKKVVSTDNGADALNLYKDLRPDLLITDIMMPDMDGVELAQRIKQINSLQKIIFITGYGDEPQMEAIDGSGIERYVLKPVKLNKLYAMIEEMFLKP